MSSIDLKTTAPELDAVAVSNRMRDVGGSPWEGMNREQLEAYTRDAAARYAARTGKRPHGGHGACDELSGYTWGGLNRALRMRGTTLSDVLGRLRSSRDDNATAIIAFHDQRGWWPRQTTNDPEEEKRLGTTLGRLRAERPDICVKYGIPLKGDRSEAIRRGQGKHQFATLAEVVVMCAQHGSPIKRSAKIGDESGRKFNLILANCISRPGASRGLGYAPDRAQVNSIAKLMAEVRADCWRFTLSGASEPDAREWAELLASGDHERIVSAERTHYLDWEDLRLRGGTRWTNDMLNSRLPDAVRRKWTPPTDTKSKHD